MKLTVSILAIAALWGCRSRGDDASAVRGDEVEAPDCLAGQDHEAADVDISACPPLPLYPDPATMMTPNGPVTVDLGAWEIYPGYKYGSLVDGANGGKELHDQNDGVTPVDDVLVTCWAKNYYRLISYLRNPPPSYVALHETGNQMRFFQFLSDARQGGGMAWGGRIASYQNHLVKWNNTVNASGVCLQHTKSEFDTYAAARLQQVQAQN
jgi:hypothetical protein